MNLFINENFIDTVGTKPSVIQLIRQIAEDDEIIHGEVLEALREVLDYDSIESLEVDIRDGDVEEVALLDDALYVEGQTLVDLFENLYPGDYTAVISALVASIQNSTGPTLRVDHNGVVAVPPEVTTDANTQLNAFVEPWLSEAAPSLSAAVAADARLGGERTQSIAEPVPADHVITAIDNQTVTVRPVQVAPFSPAEEVQRPEVAVLSSQTILGKLTFNNTQIRTVFPSGVNGVLFNVADLYNAIYGMHADQNYLQQLVRQNAGALDRGDVRVIDGYVMLSLPALATIHPHISPCVEWYPTIMKVTNFYANGPHNDVEYDLLGNLVG